MSKVTIPYFDNIDWKHPDTRYDAKIEFEGRTISLDLNFESLSVDDSVPDRIQQFLEKLPALNASNLKIIQHDYKTGDTVQEYLQFHIEEMEGVDELDAFIDPSNTALSKEEQLLAKLVLIRVGLYPDNEDFFAIFDYSFGKDITNHVIVVSLMDDGSLHHITWES
jgi:hypothetical protein